MSELDSERVDEYFARPGTVAEWWTPDEGPLAFHYDAELRVIDEQLGPQPGDRVLDVGTGRGRFGVHLARRGCDVEAVDLNPDMLELARQNAQRVGVGERFRVSPGRADDLGDFDDGRFDWVFCMELFDHLPDLQLPLAEMRRVLAPGGRFVFTYVPGESLYGSLGNVYRAWKRRTSPGDVMISRTYRLPEVKTKLAAAGLILDGYWGIGALCINAQTRLFSETGVLRALLALARAEADRWPYYETPWLARRGAHVVGVARVADPS